MFNLRACKVSSPPTARSRVWWDLGGVEGIREGRVRLGVLGESEVVFLMHVFCWMKKVYFFCHVISCRKKNEIRVMSNDEGENGPSVE